jgi:hypothetical protein
VTRHLKVLLRRRADVLQAAGALDELMETADAAGERDLYDDALALLDRPEMVDLQLMWAAQQLATGAVAPPDELAEQVRSAVRSGLPHLSYRKASDEAAAWKSWAWATDAAGQRLAQVMVRAWDLAAEDRR